MSRKTHHRSRSSVDRVLDLLSELDDGQMELLLREAESTVSGNIPVSKGIDLFGRVGFVPRPTQPPPTPPPAPRRKFLTSLSPRKQTELRRRQSKRASTQQQDLSTGSQGNLEPQQGHKKTPRSYKRISRPVFSLPPPADTADLTQLLAAYLLDASTILPSPPSPSSPSTPSSPATPRIPFSPYPHIESKGPGLDLLEPSPPRAPETLDIFSGPVRGPTRKISGIFEVLDDAGSLGMSR